MTLNMVVIFISLSLTLVNTILLISILLYITCRDEDIYRILVFVTKIGTFVDAVEEVLLKKEREQE